MAIFFEKEINNETKLAIWKIEEDENFFRKYVPQHRNVTHVHKRVQHLAGRFLLQYLYPDFPMDIIQIADTNRPYLSNEAYHFSISHCGDYAAAIVGTKGRVGIDIEIPRNKIMQIEHKFVSASEKELLNPVTAEQLTMIWSAKEAVFKWYTRGSVDFKHDIHIEKFDEDKSLFDINFRQGLVKLQCNARMLEGLVLCYIA